MKTKSLTENLICFPSQNSHRYHIFLRFQISKHYILEKKILLEDRYFQEKIRIIIQKEEVLLVFFFFYVHLDENQKRWPEMGCRISQQERPVTNDQDLSPLRCLLPHLPSLLRFLSIIISRTPSSIVMRNNIFIVSITFFLALSSSFT